MFFNTAYKYFKVASPQDGVAHVEIINRTDKLNAFTQPMWFEMRDVFQTLSFDSSVRCIVLSASGDRAFSAGLDMQWAMNDQVAFNPPEDSNIDGARRATSIRRFAVEFQDCVSAIEKCEKPVICVLHGISFGISIDISTCADIRLCSSDAKFSVKEVDIGLAADVGTLTRLPKVVGNYTWVKDVSLTARIFGAEEALKVGFVSQVLPTKDEAVAEGMRMAALIASKSPVAVQGTKNFLDWSRDHTVADGLMYTAVWNAGAVQTNDIPVAIKASLSKSKPRFEKL